MKKTYYVHLYHVGRNAYSHFYVIPAPLKKKKATGRLELIKVVLELIRDRKKYFYEISQNPEPKFPVKK